MSLTGVFSFNPPQDMFLADINIYQLQVLETQLHTQTG